ncbi:MAG: toprim domain-containing protein [Oscillospiraceae bacterium]|nr:toprim domain-containing protein [Oscillospiraceae bacterium]
MYNLEEIKQKLSCVDYLQAQGINVKSGDRCVSPLRAGAKNPTSFYVKDDFWYDFGSGQGGDVIDLAARFKHHGNKGDAIRALALMLGLRSENTSSTWHNDIQALCNRTAAYHAALTPGDYDYLAERGFTAEDAERLMIGRVTDGYLKGRLFLPYFKNGAVVYYATRALPGGSKPDSKYMKASLNECRSYEHIPWGLQTLNRGNDLLVISEGYFDAISWEKEGYSVLSPITGRFSKDQWPLVLSACKAFSKVLIIFDNDLRTHAGENFTTQTAEMLFKHKIPFVVAHTPTHIKDVNEFYSAGGNLSSLILNAVDGKQFIAQRIATIDELRKFIFSIHRQVDEIELANLLSSLSSKFSQMELKAVLSGAKKAPSEKLITEEIIKEHNLLYVDSVGFYRWNNKHWEKVSDLYVERLADTAYGLFSTAKRTASVKNLAKAKAMQNAVFDRNPVLSFQNGTLEIETGVFREHRPSDYCSIIMQYDYDAEATCPTWRKFITDITDDDEYRADVLQTIAGYVLMPTCKYQKIFILKGQGSNGKSVYLDILERVYGSDNVTHIEPTGLAQEFQRVLLKDSLLNIGSDINSDFSRGEIREWLLKIADGASIQACYKTKTHFNFAPRCKLVYACNAMPTAEIINGLNRRLQFIDFPCHFVESPDPNKPLQKQRDVNIVSKLTAELSGIFNWCYEGYKILTTVDYFTDTTEQASLLEQFETISNPVGVFCKDHVWSGTMTREEVYSWYKSWCEDTGHKPLSREKFLPKFREAMAEGILDEKYVRRDGKRVRIFAFNPLAVQGGSDLVQVF